MPKKKYVPFYAPVSVIVPCYNEEPQQLKDCIDSLLLAYGEKQIILVNNNSNKKETLEAINSYKNNKNILILKEERQGKRFAHSKGLKYAKHEFVVFVDSDTILDKYALINIIKPFQDIRIGACCGNIKIKNNDKFFTKCLDTMYWNSFEFYRYAATSLGYLYVCSGALAAYRKDLLLKLEEEYLNQKFLGRRCDISDDTFMTVRVQSRFGKKIAFCRDAIAYTYSPSNFKGFWKQLVRWRQGFLRESFLMWKEPKKDIKFLFIDAQYNLFFQTIVTILRIFFLIGLIFNFSLYYLIFYLIFFILTGALFSIYQIINRPTKIFYIISYSFIYDFVFIFTLLDAYTKIRNQGKWATR